MTYHKDASQIAAEYARREEKGRTQTGSATNQSTVWGELTVWENAISGKMVFEAKRVTIDVTKPGLLIAYDGDGTAQILCLKPGWFIYFERNEGE